MSDELVVSLVMKNVNEMEEARGEQVRSNIYSSSVLEYSYECSSTCGGMVDYGRVGRGKT